MDLQLRWIPWNCPKAVAVLDSVPCVRRYLLRVSSGYTCVEMLLFDPHTQLMRCSVCVSSAVRMNTVAGSELGAR